MALDLLIGLLVLLNSPLIIARRTRKEDPYAVAQLVGGWVEWGSGGSCGMPNRTYQHPLQEWLVAADSQLDLLRCDRVQVRNLTALRKLYAHRKNSSSGLETRWLAMNERHNSIHLKKQMLLASLEAFAEPPSSEEVAQVHLEPSSEPALETVAQVKVPSFYIHEEFTIWAGRHLDRQLSYAQCNLNSTADSADAQLLENFKKHEARVRSWTDAELFIIPASIYEDWRCRQNNRHGPRAPSAKPMIHYLKDLLGHPAFLRRGGRDHLMFAHNWCAHKPSRAPPPRAPSPRARTPSSRQALRRMGSLPTRSGA